MSAISERIKSLVGPGRLIKVDTEKITELAGLLEEAKEEIDLLERETEQIATVRVHRVDYLLGMKVDLRVKHGEWDAIKTALTELEIGYNLRTNKIVSVNGREL